MARHTTATPTEQHGDDGPMGMPTGRPATWPAAIDAWSEWLVSQHMTPATRVLRRYHANRIAAEIGCDYWQVTANVIHAWLASHPSWSRETMRSHRSTFKSFYAWCYASGYTDHNPAGLLGKMAAGTPRPRPAAEPVIDAAREAATSNRVALMLELGSRHGLRRIEVARCNVRDIWRDGTGWWLTVAGKGGKPRDVPLSDTAERLMRATAGRGGFCFPGHFTEDGIDTGHVSPYWIGRQVTRALGGQATSHQLRHRFATVTYNNTNDILEVSRLLGHASPTTTIRYVARDRVRARMVAESAG